MSYLLLAARLTLIAVMAFAAVSKLRDRTTFAASLPEFGFLPKQLIRPLSVLVPLAELVLAGLLAIPQTVPVGFALAVPFCAALTAIPVVVLVRGRKVTCACFGVGKAQMGGVHVIRNAGLLTLAVIGGWLVLSLGGSPIPTWAGILLAAATAAVLTVLAVFTDDIANLFHPETKPDYARR